MRCEGREHKQMKRMREAKETATQQQQKKLHRHIRMLVYNNNNTHNNTTIKQSNGCKLMHNGNTEGGENSCLQNATTKKLKPHSNNNKETEAMLKQHQRNKVTK
jgi:hypothetical protein